MPLKRLVWIAVGVTAGLFASRAYHRWSNAPVANIDVYDGFETPALSGLWNMSRMTGASLTMQSEIVRSGHSAAKIVLRSRDTFEAGIKGSKDTERDELQEASKLISREGILYEYGFSQYLPADFPIVPIRLVLAQWKQDCDGHAACDDDSPVVALRFTSGILEITRQNGAHRVPLYQARANRLGRWTDYRFQLRFAPNDNGILRAWIDGAPVVDYHGPTAYPENASTGYASPSHFYFKMGLYRDLMDAPMTIYLDEYSKRQLPESESELRH